MQEDTPSKRETPPVRTHWRETHCLTAGRSTAAGAAFFITFCTEGRTIGLDADPVARTILDELDAAVGREGMIIATVMPDHVHALLRPPVARTIAQVVGRIKAKTRRVLSEKDIGWQRNFFDRRVREKESLESYALYVFLNPYRAGLCGYTEAWRWTRVTDQFKFRFYEEFEIHGGIRSEWLGYLDDTIQQLNETNQP